MSVKLPVLYDSQLRVIKRLHPFECSIQEGIDPLNVASMRLLHEENISMRSIVEMFTVRGSAGFYRVTQSDVVYATGEQKVRLEHCITLLGDAIINEHKGTRTVSVTSQAEINAVIADMYIPEESEYTPHFESDTYEEDVPFEISGTAAQVFTQLLTYQTSLIKGVKPWVLGTCEATATIKREINYDNLLELINDIMDNDLHEYYLDFDMSTFPWRLNVKYKSKQISAEGRLNRNIYKFTLSYDDANLCTRVYSEKLSGGYKDSPKTAVYGVVGQHIRIDDGATTQEATNIAQRHLDNFDEPTISIEIEMRDLARITGEPFDSIAIGDRFRVTIPEHGLVVDETVIALSYDDVYAEEGTVTVSLANKTADLTWSGNKNSKTYNDSMGGAGSTAKDAEETAQAAKGAGQGTRFEVIKDKRIRENEQLYLLRAGLTVDPETGVSLFSSKIGEVGKQVANFNVRYDQITADVAKVQGDVVTAESHITQTADQIRAEVSDHVAGLNSSITQTAGQIRSELNDEVENLSSNITQTASEIRTEVADKETGLKSSIKQNADSIALNAKNIKIIADDYVTVNRLNTEVESIKQGYANSFTTSEFHGGTCTAVTLDTGALKVGNGGSAAWHTVSVDGTAVAKVLGNADINFDRAAAKAEGAAAVTLSSKGWQSGGRNIVTASNGKTYTVTLPSFSVSGGDSFDSNHQTTVYFSTSSVDGALKSKTVDATGVYNGGRTQGMSEYYSSGHWAKPSSANSWTCYVPNSVNSGAESWFSVADILPTPSYTWSNPAKGYAMVEFYICGKYYHTSKQIPGGWM